MIRKTKRIRRALRSMAASLRGQMVAGEGWMYGEETEDEQGLILMLEDQDIEAAIEWLEQQSDEPI